METEESITPSGELPMELTRLDDEFELNVTEKLQLSDSDAEVGPMRNSPAKSGAAHFEQNMSERTGATHRFTSSDSDSNAAPVKKSNQNSKKRINQLMDSEDDADEVDGSVPEKRAGQVESDDEGEVGKLMVSESDEGSPAKKIIKRMTTIVDSDSSDATPYQASDSEDGQPRKVEVKKVKKLRKKSSKSNKANSAIPDEGGSEIRSKLSALCDQSSEDDDYRAPEGEEIKAKSKVASERPPQRMSAKEAEEQMKVIQSESQRMAREANLSVPYHRPKQHSLKEFLNRHNVIRPVAQFDAPKAAAAIRMNREQLEEYAKTLEERAKESQQFFKSESEEESEAEIEPKSTKEKNEPITHKEDFSETSELADVIAERVAEISPHILDDDSNKPSETTGNIEQQSTEIESESAAKNDTPQIAQHIEIDYDFGETAKTVQASKLDLLKERIQAHVESNSSPSLKGSYNTIIDLNTGDVLPGQNAGRDELFERFLKHKAKPAKKQARDLSLLSTENGVLTMHNIVLGIHADDDPDDVIQDSKPRSAFFKLKEALGTKLAQKRRDEIMQRKADAEVATNKNKVLDEDEEEEDDEETDDGDSAGEVGGEPKNASTELPALCIDDEEEEVIVGNQPSADQDDDEENSASEVEEEDNDVEDASTGKERRRIVAQSDDSEEDEAMVTVVEPITNTQRQRTLREVDDLLDICADTNSYGLAPIESITVRAPASALCQPSQAGDEMSESQLGELCSGRFFTQAPLDMVATEDDFVGTQTELNATAVSPKATGFRLDSSDEDDTDMVGKAKPKQRRKAIQLTDDEDDGNGNQQPTAESAEEEDEGEESDVGETIDDDVVIDYDSEENEIEVVQTRKDRQKKASEFLEKEAELSESEWGSDDEDERNLDKLDIELGDADEFDDNQLHSELERIHMRRMRDADAREVKIIKDMLIEDEEETGERERQFRWKNVNDSNWDDAKQLDENGDAGMRESDDENEEAWRKMRHERELMLMDKDKLETTGPIPSPLQVSSANADATGGVTRRRRITIVKSAANTPPINAKADSPFLISRSSVLQVTRNSFLGRDDQTLARLAALSKPESDGAMAGLAKSGGNFVFSTLSPAVAPDKEKRTAKRKSDNGETPAKSSAAKKSKLNTITADATGGVKKNRLLDSLT